GEDVKGTRPLGFGLRLHGAGECREAGWVRFRGGPSFAGTLAPALDGFAEAEGEKLGNPRVAERGICAAQFALRVVGRERSFTFAAREFWSLGGAEGDEDRDDAAHE